MSPPNITETAASHLRQAISGLRGAKTSISKGRNWLPRCDADVELQLELRKLYEAEKRLIAIARKLESTERAALPVSQDEAST